jgi:phosphoadenosine phosphosulfate reductase
MTADAEQLEAWRKELRTWQPFQILEWAAETFSGRIKLATALGAEAQWLTHLIGTHRLPIPIFTLDTGRLFEETHALIQQNRERYGVDLEILFPNAEDVEVLVKSGGSNLFSKSVANRKRCCHVRKVIPLNRALEGLDAWITGLRREQSDERASVEPIEWDMKHGLFKINPLWNVSKTELWEKIHRHDVPYNELHDKGFPSIGCAPCTRAVLPGEDERAGRWWWEQGVKECGLHVVNGKLVRAQAQ